MIIELPDYSIADAIREPFTTDEMNVVIIPTNQRAIFGAGVAKLIRLGMPEVETIVREAALYPGLLSPSNLQTILTDNPHVSLALLPTKESPGQSRSTYADIARGLNTIFSSVEYGSNIIMPRVGAGLGGLPWVSKLGTSVRTIAEEIAERHSVSVYVADKYVEEGHVSQGFGVSRRAYDFCVHGWGYGDNWRPQWYGLTYDGMERLVASNPHIFDDFDRTSQSEWDYLNKRGYIEKMMVFQTRIQENSIDNMFHEPRNSFGNAHYFWREAFTDYVWQPRKRGETVTLDDL